MRIFNSDKKSAKKGIIYLICSMMLSTAILSSWTGWNVNATEGTEQGPTGGFESLIITNINKSNTTASADSIQFTTSYQSLGKVSNQQTGFSFKVTTPQSVENATNKKVLNFNLYNATGQAGKGGYVLNIAPGTTEGSIICTFNYNKYDSATDKYTETAISGVTNNLSGVGNEILVSVWLDSDKLNVMINGTLLAKVPSTTLDGLVLGTYMFGRKQDNVANDITVSDSGTATPDSSVSFEGMSILAGVDRLKLTTSSTIGQVSSQQTGFQCNITPPKGFELRIGLYNVSSSVWRGGYVLAFSQGSVEGSVSWKLQYNDMTDKLDTQAGTPVLSQQGTLSRVGDEMRVDAWLDSSGNLNVIVDGKQIVKALVKPETARLGSYIRVEPSSSISTAEQGWFEISDVVTKPDSSVDFEDISMTMNKGSVQANTVKGNNQLGQVSDTTKGFCFKVTTPSDMVKIGLYNATKNSIWSQGGYILRIDPVSEEGNVTWQLMDYTDSSGIISNGTLSNVGAKMTVYVWLDSSKRLNVIVDDKQIVKDVVTADTNLIGTYMNVNFGAEPSVANEIFVTKIVTDCNGDGITDIKDIVYLKKYANDNQGDQIPPDFDGDAQFTDDDVAELRSILVQP